MFGKQTFAQLRMGFSETKTYCFQKMSFNKVELVH